MKMRTDIRRDTIVGRVKKILSKVSKPNFRRCLILLESNLVVGFWWIPQIKKGDKVKLIGFFNEGGFEVDDYHVFNPQKKIEDYVKSEQPI
jgi:hypothetical protein